MKRSILIWKESPVYITSQVAEEFNTNTIRILTLCYTSKKLIENVDYFKLQGDSLENFKNYVKERDRDLFEINIRRSVTIYLWTKSGINKLADLIYRKKKKEVYNNAVHPIQENLAAIIHLTGMDYKEFALLLDTTILEIKAYIAGRKRLTLPVARYIVEEISRYIDELNDCDDYNWQGRPKDVRDFLQNNMRYFRDKNRAQKVLSLCQEELAVIEIEEEREHKDDDDYVDISYYFLHELSELLRDEFKEYFGFSGDYDGHSLEEKANVYHILKRDYK